MLLIMNCTVALINSRELDVLNYIGEGVVEQTDTYFRIRDK